MEGSDQSRMSWTLSELIKKRNEHFERRTLTQTLTLTLTLTLTINLHLIAASTLNESTASGVTSLQHPVLRVYHSSNP